MAEKVEPSPVHVASLEIANSARNGHKTTFTEAYETARDAGMGSEDAMNFVNELTGLGFPARTGGVMLERRYQGNDVLYVEQKPRTSRTRKRYPLA